MADYHILASDTYGNRYQVVFHIPVPDLTNHIDVSYRSAMIEWRGGASEIASQVPFISGAELTRMQAGELYEVSRSFNSNPGETLIQKQNKLDVMFNEIKAEVQSDFQDILGYWGYSRDVS